MDASIDSPQGDHVERAADANESATAQTTRTSVVMGFPPLSCGCPVERCVQGKNSSVAGDDPVALSPVSRHADDWLGEPGPAHRPIERRVSKREDTAVAGDAPVAVPRRGGSHTHDRRVEVETAHGAIELCVAEGEDAAVAGDAP